MSDIESRVAEAFPLFALAAASRRRALSVPRQPAEASGPAPANLTSPADDDDCGEPWADNRLR